MGVLDDRSDWTPELRGALATLIADHPDEATVDEFLRLCGEPLHSAENAAQRVAGITACHTPAEVLNTWLESEHRKEALVADLLAGPARCELDGPRRTD